MMVRRFLNRWRLIPALLALVACACLYFGAGGRSAAAQDNPDCEDPDTVACITVTPPPPPTGSNGSAPAAGGAAAAPAPERAIASPNCPPPFASPSPYPPPCPPCPQPYPQPYPPPSPPPYPVPPYPPMGAGAAAAAPPTTLPPVPYPYPCFNDIYRTINRANLVYARAMRTLDPSQLYAYWRGGALQSLLDQINGLQASGSYLVLRLRSIQVVDEESIQPGYAWVHTRERWVSQTWSSDGYQYDYSDAWYDNYYYLNWTGGSWQIYTDVVY